ncbi:MAG TPA: short-chain dehydrogenase [Chitinophagaceae bacterium]
MTNDQIEKFLKPEYLGTSRIQISFKTRQSIKGIFIKTNDYAELKSKNLWRIVSESKIDEYAKSKNTGLARIFNGVEMTRLSLA